MIPKSSGTDCLVFLRVFFIELVGRYAHLSKFVEQIEWETPGDSPELLSAYSLQIKRTTRELVDWYASYFAGWEDPPTDSIALGGIFDYLREKSSEFQTTHKQLRWLPSPWPETELFQFLSQVCNKPSLFDRFRRTNPTAVFSDEYNFLTADVNRRNKSASHNPSSDLGDLSISDSSKSDRKRLVVWALPKCEIGNPLLWPVLVHEVAHSIFSDDFIGAAIREALPDIKSQDITPLHPWAVELNADLFAFRLLGPAYLFCLTYFSIFFVTLNLRLPVPPSHGRVISHHPPPELRIRLLAEELETMKVDQSPNLREVRDHWLRMERLLNARLQFDFDVARTFEEPTTSPSIDPRIYKIWKVLKKVQADNLPALELPNSSLEVAVALSDLLKRSLIASSVPDLNGRRTLRAHLASHRSAPRGTRTPLSRDVLAGLNERAATVTEVLNAGWFERLRCIHIDNPSSLPNSVEDYSHIILDPAAQLRHSIQTTLIFSALAKHFNLIQEVPDAH